MIIPIKGVKNDIYKVRTLLDSGSGTNFISSIILPHLKTEYLATQPIKVTGINTTEVKSYDLYKVFINDNSCPVKHFKCYSLPGIMKYNINKVAYSNFIKDCYSLPNFYDPLQAETNHGEGLGLILGPGAIRDISFKSPEYFGPHLVDFTFFGTAVSGRMPQVNQLVTYKIDVDHEFFKNSIADDKYFYDENTEAKIELLENLQFLQDKELLGVQPNEMHMEDAICMEKFKKDVVYDHNTKKVYGSPSL